MENLVFIASDGEYYAVLFKSYAEGTITTVFDSFENFERNIGGILSDEEADWKIIFDNNETKLSRFLKENYKDSLVSKESLLGHTIYGISRNQNVASYGFDENLIKAVETVSNLEKYLHFKLNSL